MKKGVQTIRVTDTLNPSYKLPGATEIENPDFNPYGASSMDPRFLAAKKAMEARQNALKPKTLKESLKGAIEELEAMRAPAASTVQPDTSYIN